MIAEGGRMAASLAAATGGGAASVATVVQITTSLVRADKRAVAVVATHRIIPHTPRPHAQ